MHTPIHWWSIRLGSKHFSRSIAIGVWRESCLVQFAEVTPKGPNEKILLAMANEYLFCLQTETQAYWCRMWVLHWRWFQSHSLDESPWLVFCLRIFSLRRKRRATIVRKRSIVLVSGQNRGNSLFELHQETCPDRNLDVAPAIWWKDEKLL